MSANRAKDGAVWIRKSQLRWASQQCLDFDSLGYCAATRANVFWLSEDIRNEFAAGDGAEFGVSKQTERPKINALHSSAALAVNVFAYWKSKLPALPLAEAVGLVRPLKAIRFEQRYPTPVRPGTPNLDVVLETEGGQVIGVESKFCEPYGRHVGLIQQAYLRRDSGLWLSVGLPGVQHAAEQLASQAPYTMLDAPQLLKHMLGLANAHRDWCLLLLWYETPLGCSQVMQDEIAAFRTSLGSDAHRFQARSHQSFWQDMLTKISSEHDDYRIRVGKRYFDET